MKTAVCFLTHSFSPELRRRWEALLAGTPEGARAFILAQKGSDVPPELEARTHWFDFAALRVRARKVVGDRLVPGNVHLAFLDFRRAHPGFERYWFVEYDVAFHGDWRDFFAELDADPADLLASRLRAPEHEPGWYWWPTLDLPGGPPPARRLRAFFPVCRFSAAALDAVGSAVDRGWTGHHEGVVPTAAREAGLTLSDIGGDGPWTPPSRRGRLYTSVASPDGEMLLGTMRAAPPHFLPFRRRGFLYHPVKERRVPNLGDLARMRQALKLLLVRPRVARDWLSLWRT